VILRCLALLVPLWLAPGTLLGADGPREHRAGDIVWISGGIGDEELALLKATAPRFNLQLTFALGTRGEYAADVGVVIEAGGRKLVEAAADGPLFFAALPAGRYRVVATYRGEARITPVTIDGKRPVRASIRWQRTGAEDPSGPAVPVDGPRMPR
jgi:hypothetical protein